MAAAVESAQAKILILATIACAYPGADTVGQTHSAYSTNTYVLRIPAPVMLPEEFYFRTLDKGIGGIIVMSLRRRMPVRGSVPPFRSPHGQGCRQDEGGRVRSQTNQADRDLHRLHEGFPQRSKRDERSPQRDRTSAQRGGSRVIPLRE